MFYNTILSCILKGAGIQQPTDSRINSKIEELVYAGVVKVEEMGRHLNQFVTHELFGETEVTHKTNRRFFPTDVDMRNYIYMATRKQQYSTME